MIKKITPYQHLVILVFVAVGVALAVYDFQLSRKAIRPVQVFSVHEQLRLGETIQPVPLHIELDQDKVALGDRLYHDPRLSADNQISCATCHDLNKGGTDQLALSKGIGGALGNINSPTTFNSGFHFVQFWDGRVRTLEEQVAGPIHNPVEMGTTWPEIVAKLSRDADYPRQFAAIYPQGITAETIADAIAVFEISLYTPNAPFDRYLRGDQNAIDADAVAGYALFRKYGCVACHQGINIGGNMYQTIGVMEDYFDHRDIREVDLGRYNVTGQVRHKFQFKVPTLRNIALTFPYLHDGSAETLEDVLRVMWNSQLGRSLDDEESRLLIAFMKTLTGEYRGRPL